MMPSAKRDRLVRAGRAVSSARPASCTLVEPSTKDCRLVTAFTHLMLPSPTCIHPMMCCHLPLV